MSEQSSNRANTEPDQIDNQVKSLPFQQQFSQGLSFYDDPTVEHQMT